MKKLGKRKVSLKDLDADFAKLVLENKSIWDENRQPRKKLRKNSEVDFAELGLEPPAGMPTELQNYMESIGGEDPQLVIMKILQYANSSLFHGRLLIPSLQVRSENFLKPEERTRLVDNRGEIDVTFVHPLLDETTPMKLKWLKMNGGGIFALVSGWNSFIKKDVNMEENRIIKSKAIIQVWSFRRHGALWFALTLLRPGEDDH